MSTEIIRPSRLGDENSLRELWSLCFDDGPEFIESFFEKVYSPGIARLVELDGRLVSACYLLTDIFVSYPDGSRTDCPYLYALGTHPDYRGLGLAERLVRSCGFIATLPATPELYGWYEGLGARAAFWLREKSFTVSGNPGGTVSPVSAGRYLELREAILAPYPHAVIPTPMLELQGGLYELETGCAAAELTDEGLIIKELLADESAAQLLAHCLGCKSGKFRSPVFFGDGELRDFVCVTGEKLAPNPQLYWGLALD